MKVHLPYPTHEELTPYNKSKYYARCFEENKIQIDPQQYSKYINIFYNNIFLNNKVLTQSDIEKEIKRN